VGIRSDRGPVLDASALLAYLGNEPGAERVADAIAGRAVMSSVNLAEVLSTAAARGADPQQLARDLSARGLLDGALSIEVLTIGDAVEVARLRPITRAAGLSLADRVCLALGRRLAALVLTADSAWAGLDLGVAIELLR
jgi:ribonuclease VapC